MTARTALLKQLVDDGSYPIDEAAIAEAILVRSMARRMLPEVAFRPAAAASRRCARFARTAARARFASLAPSAGRPDRTRDAARSPASARSDAA